MRLSTARTIEEAITTALHTTGAAVFSTFAVMIGGIVPWAFSPLLFHNEMSVLLDLPHGDEHDRGRADPAGVHRVATAALHRALREKSRQTNCRRGRLTKFPNALHSLARLDCFARRLLPVGRPLRLQFICRAC